MFDEEVALHKVKMRNIGLVMALILATLATAPVAFGDKLSDYQKQQEQLSQQAKGTQSSISSLQNKEAALQGQIVQIQSQVSSLQKQITSTQIDLDRRNQQIQQLRVKIQHTQLKLNAQYAVLKNRIRLMYESGQTSYMDVLFSSSSFSDLLSRMQLLSMVAKQDKTILTQVEVTKRELQSSSKALLKQQASEQALSNSLKQQQARQASAMNREQQVLKNVHDERIKEEVDLQNENAAMANLKQAISQLEASMGGGYTGPADGWVWPVPQSHNISSGYGNRTWSDGHVEFHNGIDIPAPLGTPIVAATGGKVLMAGPASGFGDWIVIQSAGGLLEIYGHMYSYEIRVSPGQVVSAGQQIAAVGSNGESTGPHLHFTIATGFDSAGYAISVNPMNYVHP